MELCILSANQRLDSHVPGFRKFDGEGSEHEVEKEAAFRIFFLTFNEKQFPGLKIQKDQTVGSGQPTRGPPNRAFLEASGDRAASEAASETPSLETASTGGGVQVGPSRVAERVGFFC